ncbi:hypothetical protein [Microbacterium resistens]
MTKLIELIGLLAPFAAMALLFLHRRRAPGPAGIGMIGAAIAAVGSVADVIGSRTVWFGGDSGEMLEQLEWWGMLRLGLVGAGVAILLTAALVGRGRAVPRIPLAVGGLVAAGLGVLVPFAPVGVEDLHGFLRFVVTMGLETLQFGLLGAGILLLALAVVSGRDEGPEPLAHALRAGGRIIRAVRNGGGEAPGRTGSPGTGSAGTGSTLRAVWSALTEEAPGSRATGDAAADPTDRTEGADSGGRRDRR